MFRTVLLILLTAILSISVFAFQGTLDTTFGGNGMVTFNGNTTEQFGNAVAVQPNGKIVVAGGIGPAVGNGRDILLLRFNPDGSLDPSFGINGVVRSQVGISFSEAFAVIIQRNGKIIVGGLSATGANLIRYNPNGTIDQNFGTNGVTMAGGMIFLDIAIDTDDRILAVGDKFTGVSEFLVQRFNTDGTLDTSYGLNGTANVGFFNAHATSLDLLPNGNMVVAGWVNNGNNKDFAVANLTEDGELIRSFGVDGLVVTDINGNDSAFGVAFGPNGSIYVAGESGLPKKMTAVKYLSNGLLDQSFRTGGLITNQAGIVTTNSGSAKAITVERSGQILIAGVDETSRETLVVQKLNANGSMARWGKKGSASATYGSLESQGLAMTLFSGSIFVSGQVKVPNIVGVDVGIAKFHN